MEFICIRCETVFEHCGCDSGIKSTCNCTNSVVVTKKMFDNITNHTLTMLVQDCSKCDLYTERGLLNGKPLFVCKMTNRRTNDTCPLNLF